MFYELHRENNGIRLNLPALCNVNCTYFRSLKIKCCLKEQSFVKYSLVESNFTWPQSPCSQKAIVCPWHSLQSTQLKHYLRLSSLSVWLHLSSLSSSSASVIHTLWKWEREHIAESSLTSSVWCSPDSNCRNVAHVH